MTLTGPVAAPCAACRRRFQRSGRRQRAGHRLQIDWKLDLEGRVDGAPQPVRLAMSGSANGQRVELNGVRAQAGAASAEMQATLQRAGRGEWQLQTTGSLVDFNPCPGGRRGRVGLAAGPHRVSADWDLTLRLPGNPSVSRGRHWRNAWPATAVFASMTRCSPAVPLARR